jgi:hypothetical protein
MRITPAVKVAIGVLATAGVVATTGLIIVRKSSVRLPEELQRQKDADEEVYRDLKGPRAWQTALPEAKSGCDECAGVLAKVNGIVASRNSAARELAERTGTDVEFSDRLRLAGQAQTEEADRVKDEYDREVDGREAGADGGRGRITETVLPGDVPAGGPGKNMRVVPDDRLSRYRELQGEYRKITEEKAANKKEMAKLEAAIPVQDGSYREALDALSACERSEACVKRAAEDSPAPTPAVAEEYPELTEISAEQNTDTTLYAAGVVPKQSQMADLSFAWETKVPCGKVEDSSSFRRADGSLTPVEIRWKEHYPSDCGNRTYDEKIPATIAVMISYKGAPYARCAYLNGSKSGKGPECVRISK